MKSIVEKVEQMISECGTKKIYLFEKDYKQFCKFHHYDASKPEITHRTKDSFATILNVGS